MTSGPSAAETRGSSRVDLFATATNGQIAWNLFNGSGWSGWASLGGTSASGPAGPRRPGAVARGAGGVDVFVCGTDSKLWQNHFDNFGWTGWLKPVGDDGVLAGAPVAVSWAPTRVDVFVPGLDGVYHRFYDQGWNSSWEALGTPPVGLAPNTDLAVASWGPNRIDLFAVGADQKLYQKFTDGRTWSGWGVPPGTEAGSITAVGAASWGANQVAVFGRGTDSGLYWTNFYRGFWGAWQRIGNPGDVVINAPSAGSRGCQSIDVFVAGTDQRCYQFSYNGG